MASNTIEKAVTELTPPILMRTLRSVRRRFQKASGQQHVESGEKGPEWYDRSFTKNAHAGRHYTTSGYYFLWTVIAD